MAITIDGRVVDNKVLLEPFGYGTLKRILDLLYPTVRPTACNVKLVRATVN